MGISHVVRGHVVGAQGITLPRETSKDELQHVEVLLALYIEPRGKEGSTVYVARVVRQGRMAQTVTDLSGDMKKEALAALKKDPTELAAALIVDQFFEHLTTQIFYEDRWKDKLIRRFSGTAGSQ